MGNQYESFFHRIDALSSGEKSALKRSVGITLRNASGKAFAAFYRCLPNGIPSWQEDRWFAVACIYCLYGKEQTMVVVPLEKIICNAFLNKGLSESIQHKIEILIDTSWDDDGYMLAKLVRLIKMITQKTGTTNIDFNELLKDLIFWNAENKSVQRKWALTIFSEEAPN